LLITANQPFDEWGRIFPDQAMTLAAIDRIKEVIMSVYKATEKLHYTLMGVAMCGFMLNLFSGRAGFELGVFFRFLGIYP
jgi:hypothetical protein